MSATDVVIGEPLPLLAKVSAHEGHSVAVSWANRDRPPVVVDLAPLIFTLKFYKPLRDDLGLFRTVHLIAEGAGIAWGEDDAIDMDASSIERLASEIMEKTDFKAFLERHKLTLEAAAAQLGVSRRLVAYWAGGKRIPRYIALACHWLDHIATGKSDASATALIPAETDDAMRWREEARHWTLKPTDIGLRNLAAKLEDVTFHNLAVDLNAVHAALSTRVVLPVPEVERTRNKPVKRRARAVDL